MYVLLPTNDKSPLMIDSLGILCYAPLCGFEYFDHDKNHTHVNKQHLYKIERDLITKAGDWCINDNLDKLYQIEQNDSYGWSRVVKSTDTKISVPTITNEYITWFFYCYNRGK